MNGLEISPPDGLSACRNDVLGAQAAGCFAWLWYVDVHSLQEVVDRITRVDDPALL